MNAQELREKYLALYEYMAQSKDPANMNAFGKVMTEMMNELIAGSPNRAEEYISKLEAIRWNEYLTRKEAEKIVSEMNPKAPWSYDQWKAAMEQYGYPLDCEPCYNRYALWVVMEDIMSKSSNTISKYIDNGKVFSAVYDLAVDMLTNDYMIRHMFGV